MSSHISSVAYDHTKHSNQGSLTSIVLYDTNKTDIIHDLTIKTLESHIDCLADRTIKFYKTEYNSKPLLDILNIDTFDSRYHSSVYKKLRARVFKIFSDLREMKQVEDLRSNLGIQSDPWDKYLLLDSRYFLKMVSYPVPMDKWQQIAFLQLFVYTVEEEIASQISLDPLSFVREFLKFIDSSSAYSLHSLKNKKYNEKTLKRVNSEVIVPFYDMLKKNGCLKEFKEDYHELVTPSMVGGIDTLPKKNPEEKKTVLTKSIQNIFKS